MTWRDGWISHEALAARDQAATSRQGSGMPLGFQGRLPFVCPMSYDGSRLAMTSLDWSQCPEVESIPGKVSGAWVFRGTRAPVSAIFENLKCSSLDEVLENFHVSREQVQAVLDFAAKSAEPPRAA